MNVNAQHKALSDKAKALRETIASYRRLRSVNATASRVTPRGTNASQGGAPRHATGAVPIRQDPVRSVVVSRESSRPAPNPGPSRPQPTLKSIAEVSVAKPLFTAGKTCLSKPAMREGKKVGVVQANLLEGKMPHAEFKYSSKQFIDEMGETVSGSEYLTTVFGSRSGQDGACISTLLLSPLTFRNTRLFQRTGLWNRFRFRKVAVEYIPTVASTVGGELSMAVSVDPTIS